MEKGTEGKAGERYSRRREQAGLSPFPSLAPGGPPAPLRRQPPARPSEPAKACAAPAPRWRPPPLTGCRRPRSARRGRCWGGAGSGTWRRRWRQRGRGAGEAASERQGPGAAGSRAAEATLRSCTQRHRRPPAASRETSRGASGESSARGGKHGGGGVKRGGGDCRRQNWPCPHCACALGPPRMRAGAERARPSSLAVRAAARAPLTAPPGAARACALLHPRGRSLFPPKEGEARASCAPRGGKMEARLSL